MCIRYEKRLWREVDGWLLFQKRRPIKLGGDVSGYLSQQLSHVSETTLVDLIINGLLVGP
jgi:hypothetical protein